MNAPTIITFIVYLIGMLAIGVIAYRLTSNLSDYILGGRGLGPGVAALSAGASDMSGWLLLGLPGAIYLGGMSGIWIGIGLSIGAFLNWYFVARRLRSATEKANDSLTLPAFFENYFHDTSRILRAASAVVILVFFTIYTAAGLVGGAKLFSSTFGMDYTSALWLGSLVIIAYTFLGGFLAVSWTDFIQGLLMFFALIIVPIFAVSSMGGWSETLGTVASIDASFLDIMAGTGALSIISLMAWGLGYFGQPHILARFMAIRSPEDVPLARFIGIGWMVVGLFGALFAGFVGVAFFAQNPLADGETVFISLIQALFNPWVAGVLLAAVLAAIMSTIDSQLLVCSSALAEDFYKSFMRRDASDNELVWISRFAVVGVALIALVIGSNPESTVLGLVSYAWAGFGAAFGSLVLMSLYWPGTTRNGALAGMIVGAVTVIVWKQLSGGLFDLYEIVPGFIFSVAAIYVVSRMGAEPDPGAVTEYKSA